MQGKNTDLVIVDEQLDDMSGIEFVGRLVQVNPLVNTAIVGSLSDEDFHEATEGLGVLSRFRVRLAEFEGIRWLLQLACPVFLVLMVTQVKNLLFPRALGIFGLMVAAPLLSAAFLQEPVTRLLIPIWCYIVIFLSILWIGKPYLYRDMVNKICSKPAWWTPLCLGGMAYGAAILLCAILWW